MSGCRVRELLEPALEVPAGLGGVLLQSLVAERVEHGEARHARGGAPAVDEKKYPWDRNRAAISRLVITAPSG
jgi:hypothetical protein